MAINKLNIKMNIDNILNKYIKPKRIGNEKYMVLTTNLKTLKKEIKKKIRESKD